MNNKNQGISRTPAAAAILFAALMLAVLMPLRLWQQMRLVEQGTGFWAGGDVTVPLLYAALGVLAAVPAVVALALRKYAALDLTRKRRVTEGVTAALAAAALVVDAVLAINYALRLISGAGVSFDDLDSWKAWKALMVLYVRSGAMACVLECFFGTLSAVFFVRLAAIDFLPRKKIYLSRALALAPFAWAVCRILRRFSRTIAYLRVSDLFLGLAMLVALMIFLLAFAQNVGGRGSGYRPAVLAAAGIPAAVLALLCFVPRLVTYSILGHTAPQDALIEWCDPAMAAFMLAFIAGRLFTGPPREMLQEEQEDEEDEEECEEYKNNEEIEDDSVDEKPEETER